MLKSRYFLLASILLTVALSAACSNSPKIDNSNPINLSQTQAEASVSTQVENTGAATGQTGPNTAETAASIDLQKVKPNEVGKIMVVMFHNFVAEYKSGDKYYTTTFADFEKLLETLYSKGYRLISMDDYLNNNITVPAGYIPMVFTFDDGTAGQFNLIDEGGVLTANRESAVGVMEEFNKKHPDFGTKGTFYVNLGDNTFAGKGTIQERLGYLIDKGFEIGNHTYSHIKLTTVKSADVIQEEIGGNQKKMLEIIPGYIMKTFSLPYGLPSKELQSFVAKGEYQGVEYENKAVMEVGWDPAYPPSNRKFNPLSTHRVRAAGLKPVEADLNWWLLKLKRDEQYISDGNPDTVTVPSAKEESVDKTRLGDKKLVIY